MNKCYEKGYLEFLAYLAEFESAGFKVYNLLEAIHTNTINLDKCYQTLANQYILLENSMGAPHLALRKLSEVVPHSELSRFLRDYSNVAITSGDTKSFVESTLKQELYRYRVKIGELLRLLEVLYESFLLVVFILMVVTVFPFISMSGILRAIVFVVIGLSGYVVAYYICAHLYYEVPRVNLVLDLLMLVLVSLVFVVPSMPAYLLPIMLASHVVSKSASIHVEKHEHEAVNILHTSYARVLMGEPLGKSIVSALGTSELLSYKLVWLGLLMGLSSSRILDSANTKLPMFSKKILSLALSVLPYSYQGSVHLVHVATIVDEINATRGLVREKAKYYILYSIAVSAIVFATYVLLTRVPAILAVNPQLLASYSYAGSLISAQPATLLRERGFTSSKTAVLLLIVLTVVYFAIIFM